MMRGTGFNLCLLTLAIALAQNTPDSQELWRHRNLGKALFETPTTISEAPAELKKALDLAPNSFRDRLNYGLALLRAGDLDNAIVELEKAQKQDAKSPYTWFNLGIAYKRQRRSGDAARQFKAMLQLLPDEPVAHYNLGLIYKLQGHPEEALKEFVTAAKLDRSLVAPRFQIYNYYRLKDDEAATARARAEFEQAKSNQKAADETEDMEWCYYAELYDPEVARPSIPAPTEAHAFDLAALPGKVDPKTARLLVADVDGDLQPDLIVSSRNGIDVYLHGRDLVPNSGLAAETNVIGVAAGDFDNDGLVDLCVLTESGARLYRNVKGRFVRFDANLPAGRFDAAVWLDFDHDYDLDLFLLGENSVLLRNEGASGFHDYTAHFPFIKGRANAATVFRLVPDAKGMDLAVSYAERPAVLYRDRLRGVFEPQPLPPTPLASFRNSDSALQLFTKRSQTSNWIEVALVGVKNLKTAVHSEVEIKAGDLYEKRLYQGIPLLFDLGAHTNIDTVRITWANGMIQNETNPNINRAILIKEAPRLSGSCPMIFTWNGRGFEFITDVLGVAPLGASSGDGQTFPLDHDEYVFIPGESLAARDGRYDVRVTEELHEVSYIDQVRLIALDHPSDVEVYTNEKFKSPPFPDFRLYRVKKHLPPVSATDDSGRDLLPALLERDRVYARGFRHDSAGVAELHSLTLDFGPAAANLRHPVLFLNGWVDWADGSTFFGASQGNKAGLIMPYLQVRDAAGAWRNVIDDMGIPAGKPKTIAVDLTGKFASPSLQVRIVTSLCVYWDQIFLADNMSAPVTQIPVETASADLRLRGFSRAVIDPAREQPEAFDYAQVTTGAPWDQTPGFYTRYGDVRELLNEPDDRFVIMGSGDEISFSFDGRSLPPLAPGWKRDFLLLVDGWAKDADANTAFSQTVEPLPFHAMSGYPYASSERFPDDAAHQTWTKQYNTRPAIRLVQPLVTRRTAPRAGDRMQAEGNP